MHNNKCVCVSDSDMNPWESMDWTGLWFFLSCRLKFSKCNLKKISFPPCCRMQGENSLSTDCRQGFSARVLLGCPAFTRQPAWATLGPAFHAVTLFKLCLYTPFRILTSSWPETFWENCTVSVSAVSPSGFLQLCSPHYITLSCSSF